MTNSQRIGLVCLTIIVLVILVFSLYNQVSEPNHAILLDHRRLDIQWGTTFSGVSSSNVRKDNCPYFDTYEEADKIDFKVNHKRTCEITREYFPSEYELHHAEFAASVAKIDGWQEREWAVLNFTTSPQELDYAVRWMTRVNVRMASDENPSLHPDDTELLSRFIITEKCEGHAPVKATEYIEPLTIHGRNPFSYLNCEIYWKNDFYDKRLKPVSHLLKEIQNLDYVLLHGKGHSRVHDNYYLFDAGTSRYDSGIWWLLCGYFQVLLAQVTFI